MKTQFRFAEKKDTALILSFIKGLAEYEKMPDQVVADEKLLGEWIFEKQIAVERGCGRLEWWCLDWNKPSIDFYLSLGAEPMSDWTTYRIAGEKLKRLSAQDGE